MRNKKVNKRLPGGCFSWGYFSWGERRHVNKILAALRFGRWLRTIQALKTVDP